MVARHFVEIDGRKLEAIKGRDRLELDQLKPNSCYIVKVRAVGSNERTSSPAILALHTLAFKEEVAPTALGELHLPSPTRKTKSGSAGSSGGSSGSSGSGGSAARRKDNGLNEIAKNIENAQMEIKEVLEQQNGALLEFEAEQKLLHTESGQLTDARRKDEQARNQQRAEIKVLEDSRRALETQKLKLSRQYREIQDTFNTQHSAQDRWATEARQWDDTNDALDKSIGELQTQRSEQEAVFKAKIARLTAEASELESETRQKTQALHSAEHLSKDTLNRLDSLRKHTDIATGIVVDDALTSAVREPSANGSLLELVISDCALDAQLEQEWVNAQAELEARYINAYAQYEQASRALKEATASAQQSAQRASRVSLASLASSGSRPLAPTLASSGSITSLSSGLAPSTSPGRVGLQPLTSLYPQASLASGASVDVFDSPAMHSWLTPRGSLESSRSSSLFFARNAPVEPLPPSAMPAPAPIGPEVPLPHVALPPMSESHASEPGSPIRDDDLPEGDVKTPRKGRKGFFALDTKPGKGSFVRRLSFFNRKEEES